MGRMGRVVNVAVDVAVDARLGIVGMIGVIDGGSEAGSVEVEVDVGDGWGTELSAKARDIAPTIIMMDSKPRMRPPPNCRRIFMA